MILCFRWFIQATKFHAPCHLLGKCTQTKKKGRKEARQNRKSLFEKKRHLWHTYPSERVYLIISRPKVFAAENPISAAVSRERAAKNQELLLAARDRSTAIKRELRDQKPWRKPKFLTREPARGDACSCCITNCWENFLASDDAF